MTRSTVRGARLLAVVMAVIDAIADDQSPTMDHSIKPSAQALWLRIVRDRSHLARS
ncbi:MAG TPA: hypothetical protein VID95_14405 [Candidatus Limnocylindrales bacterium]|jgi:hypothetical protein